MLKKKILIAPDKFKGSLTSFQVCNAVEEGLLAMNNNLLIKKFPLADGGDGFASIIKYYLHTETIYCSTVDPLMRPIKASYEWDEKNSTAIIELSSASGLVLLKEDERNPLYTSTFGTGLMIKHAIEKKKAAKIILGVGGSATNDGGIGILAALGFSLIGKGNKTILPVGENLSFIENILEPQQKIKTRFSLAVDVQNTLYGKNGAAYIYARQKGANDYEIKLLDNGLRHLTEIIFNHTGKRVEKISGIGAAGGVGATLFAFFKTEIINGADFVINKSNIKKNLKNAFAIITGEGKIDKQTAEGKVINKIIALAQNHHIPVYVVCGITEINKSVQTKWHIKNLISIEDKNTPHDYTMKHAYSLLKQKLIETILIK